MRCPPASSYALSVWNTKQVPISNQGTGPDGSSRRSTPSRAPYSGVQVKGMPCAPLAAMAWSNRIGRSMKTTWPLVRKKSCIIVAAATSTGRLSMSCPDASAR
jgi:hypothetical protein